MTAHENAAQIIARITRERAKNGVNGAGLEEPRPLIRELPPADPFPVEALGDILGAATTAINDRIRAPMAISGQSVLAAATLATQGHADIRLPTGQARPISGFFLTIAETGERKTATDAEALSPVRARENALLAEYDITLPDYENAKLAWEKARDHAVALCKGNRTAIIAALKAIGPAPAAPLTAMLTCTEPTYEGLCKHFTSGLPSAGIFSDEGGQFIGGHGMAQDAKLRTAAGLSGLWDGQTIRRVRAKEGTIIMPGRRVALHLMAQPGVAAVMLSDPQLLDQGLLSRCLVTAPESAAGTRMWRDQAIETAAVLARYHNRILAMLERPLPLADGKTNELLPRVLSLAPAATRLWTAFADDTEIKMRPEGGYSPIKGLANKLAEHAARLAAVLALVADIDAAEVSAEYMSAGIILAQHYAFEALRLFESSRVSADLALAQKLLAWLSTWPEPAISLPDIYQSGPRAIRDKATAARLVAILDDHGWLVRIADGATVAGKHRREAWRIVRD